MSEKDQDLTAAPAEAQDGVRAWPSDGQQIEITFAVSIDGHAFLVSAPESVRNANDESATMDKYGWEGLPEDPGFYKAKAEFWFQKGYFEGYPAPGESSYGWAITDCALIPSRTPDMENPA